MQGVADELAGVCAVDDLRDRAQRAREPETLGHNRGEFHGGRGDEPYPLAGVEMVLGKGEGSGPQLVDHDFVEDLDAELDYLRHTAPGDEPES
ncbi:unannotated protein [freshwater metagenome]|uniref:Unannotated protein n=1 Tax=freshwater metagenome TaxID=449393 RepID=A0A6J7JZ00_9ZZZZ